MKQNSTLAVIFLFIISALFFNRASSQLPAPALIGYWQNWNDANAPYIPLNNIDSRYNVIEVSFAIPGGGTDYQMEFTPTGTTQAGLISQIQALQAQGKKVIISMGGATAPVSLDNATEKNAFISSMNGIIDTYGFDGIDVDFEGSSLSVSGGTIDAPVDAPIINLIDAIKQIMNHHRDVKQQKLLLTMAPETVFVQGGMSAYSGIWGAYLPVIQALRDSIDMLQVQLYNSGTMYGIDHQIYTQATADFIVAMTEAAIKGFTTAGGTFNGLPASKVAVGLPACTNAAGGGYTDPAVVRSAINYLRGTGPKPGSYTLQEAGGYPSMRSMMTWSINWDAVSTCGSVYEYAANYQTIFFTTLPLTLKSFTGTYSAAGNMLKWITADQVNTAYFIIEKSKDGARFYNADTVKAKNGNGNISYTYTDKDAAGSNYYRLKMVDANGSLKYSAIISLAAAYVNTLVTYPNPVKDYITIRMNDNMSNALVRLINMQGKIVKPVMQVSGSVVQLNISELPAGSYILQVYSGEKQYQNKIIKQ